jgi:hypothetical protein
MRPLVSAALALSLILASGRYSKAEDTPRAVLQRAVKAMGGGSSGPVATHYLMRGKLPFGGKEDFAFTGEVFTQPNGDFKYAFEVGVGTTMSVTMSLVGAKGWRIVGGKLEDLDEANLAELKLGRYYDRVTSIAPLLKDDSFKLESLPEIKVHNDPAIGVKVSSRGQPGISLFFDKNTSLLIKTQYSAPPPGQDKEMLHETYYSEWREPDHTAADEQTLKAVRVQTDGPALVDYLRKRMPAGGDVARIKQLVEQLGDDSFETRNKASEALIATGTAAIPHLRGAAESGDPEVKRRAKLCLDAIGRQPDEKPVVAAVRLLGWRKPAGAAELLLDWASRCGDDALGREVRSALVAVAIVDGKPAPVLVAALEDKDAARRDAAAFALGKDDGKVEKIPGCRLYLAGLKFPMKAVQYQDGAKMLEREYTRIELFNRFDDATLSRQK